MMVGFESNKNAEWHSVCHFFPEFNLDTDQRLSISMPELSLKRDFRPIEKSDSINLAFYVIAVEINSHSICASFTMEISSRIDYPATVWTTDSLPTNQLLFAIGLCKMDFVTPDKDLRKEAIASCYLWADLSYPK